MQKTYFMCYNQINYSHYSAIPHNYRQAKHVWLNHNCANNEPLLRDVLLGGSTRICTTVSMSSTRWWTTSSGPILKTKTLCQSISTSDYSQIIWKWITGLDTTKDSVKKSANTHTPEGLCLWIHYEAALYNFMRVLHICIHTSCKLIMNLLNHSLLWSTDFAI